MTRYSITVEYDGRGFVGWQHQDNGLAVQQVLEDAIEAFHGERVQVFGAGRTDSGVHALAQVAHFDLSLDMEPGKVRDAINAHLRPHSVSVLTAERAAEDFHCRFSATQRGYLYRITCRRAPLTLTQGLSWRVPVELDAEAMHDAAQVLPGKHDFTTFRASHCQAKSPLKTLDCIEVARHGEDITITTRARSFLHHQVRNMVGTLKLVGEGKWSRDDVKAALDACDRRAGGPTAPADGLYLTDVVYGGADP
jgi:tRNA pseudouridine38-40 synthase